MPRRKERHNGGEVVEYKIVTHSDPKDTQDEVNSFLAEGWELYGDLKHLEYWVGGDSDDSRAKWSFSQAMIRREQDEFTFGKTDVRRRIEIL